MPAKTSESSRYQASSTGTGQYTHADFTYVRRKRGPIVEEEDMGELNIVPYLDIVINLIMFLLVAQATLVHLGLIDVTAPSYASAAVSPGQKDPQTKALHLTIGIAQEGFFIAAKGGVLPGSEKEGAPGQTADGVARREPTIPRNSDGTYNFPALRRKLRAIKNLIKAEHPAMKAQSVYIAADERTTYETIVKTLDNSRSDKEGPLFPQVAFTQIN